MSRGNMSEDSINGYQEQLLLYHLKHPRETAFTELATVVFAPCDIVIAQSALDALAQRHPLLRTEFSYETTGADLLFSRHVRQSFSVPMKVVLEKEQQESALHDFQTQPFQPFETPPIKALLLIDSPQKYTMVILVHRVLLHSMCVRSLAEELNDDIKLRVTGKYQSYDSRDKCTQNIADGNGAAPASSKDKFSNQWWHRCISDVPEELPLPYDRVRSGKINGEAGFISFDVNKISTSGLISLCEEHGTGLLCGLSVLWSAILLRISVLSGHEDVLLGIPRSFDEHELHREAQGRRITDSATYVLPLRVRVSEDSSLQDVIAQTHSNLVCAQDMAQNFMHTSMFAYSGEISDKVKNQLEFQLDRSDVSSQQLRSTETLELDMLKYGHFTSHADLVLKMTHCADGAVIGRLVYDTELFDEVTVEKIVSNFLLLIDGSLSRPHEPLRSIPLTDAAEYKRVVHDFNNTLLPYPNKCVHELFFEQMKRTPDAVAVEFLGGETVSYRALYERAEAVASLLVGHGVSRGSMVAVLLPRSVKLVVAVWAVIMAGAAYVPVDVTLPVQRIEWMLEDANVSLILLMKETEGKVSHERLPMAISLDQEPSVSDAHTTNFPETVPDDPLTVIFTSGSTGRPKGALLLHRGAVNLATIFVQRWSLSAEDRIFQWASPSFDVAMWDYLLAFSSGARLVLWEGYWREELIKAQPSYVFLTPSALNTMSPSDLPSTRVIAVGGEQLPLGLATRWAKTHLIVNAYGPTEATVETCVADMSPDDSVVEIGPPLPNYQVYVLDNKMNPLPVGMVGELFIAGVGLAREYLGRPELTAARFLDNPFGDGKLYRTGDFARWTERGTIVCLGRMDGQVKLRGQRIELEEIEFTAHDSGLVQSAAAMIHGADNRQQLVLYVTPEDVVPNALVLALGRRLPPYMVPSLVVPLKSLPLTTSGKLDRKQLPPPKPATINTFEGNILSPTDDGSSILSEILSELESLFGTRVGKRDKLVEVGLDSLTAIRFSQSLCERFRRSCLSDSLISSIHPTLFFKLATAERIADFLEGCLLDSTKNIGVRGHTSGESNSAEATLSGILTDIKAETFLQNEFRENNLSTQYKQRVRELADTKPNQPASFSIVGAGGHCKELVHQLTHAGCRIEGIYDDDAATHSTDVEGVPVKGGLQTIPLGSNWLIAVGQNETRRQVSLRDSSSCTGLPFIHPSVGHVPSSTTIAAGSTLLENVRVGPNVRIGKHCIICFGASIAHDCIIEDYAFIGERAVIAGNVRIGEGAMVGIGSVVGPRRSVGAWSTVMMSSAVCQDVPSRHSCGGVPAVVFGPTTSTKVE